MTIVVRRATVDDAAGYARIMGDPAVYPGLAQLPFTNADTWRTRLAESTAPGKPDLLLVAERDGRLVGNCGLHPMWGPTQVRRRHVANLGIAVAADARRQGVGSALMQAMCDYADRWLGLLRLELTVYVDNAAAIALYRKCGFETEGLLRGYAMRDGRLVDALTMARLHPAPPTIEPAAPGLGANLP